MDGWNEELWTYLHPYLYSQTRPRILSKSAISTRSLQPRRRSILVLGSMDKICAQLELRNPSEIAESTLVEGSSCCLRVVIVGKGKIEAVGECRLGLGLMDSHSTHCHCQISFHVEITHLIRLLNLRRTQIIFYSHFIHD